MANNDKIDFTKTADENALFDSYALTRISGNPGISPQEAFKFAHDAIIERRKYVRKQS